MNLPHPSPRHGPRSASIAGGYRLRPAEAADVASIVGLITELAEFESLTHLLQLTPQKLQMALFGEHPLVECVVVEHPEPQRGGAPALVAFALFFTNFSTFLGQPGLYLEDLYVQPAHRRVGLGKALLEHLGRLAVARGYGRFEWSVLDWNENAIGFYQRMGATLLPDWRVCRVTGEALKAFGQKEGSEGSDQA